MKNLLGTLSAVLFFVAPSLAFAQAPKTTPKPAATVAPAATPMAVATPEPVAAPMASEEPDDPSKKKWGIGAGWVWNGTSVFVPNTVSARFYLENYTIEPLINASITQNFTHQHVVVGDQRPSQAARDYAAQITLAAQVRKHMKQRGSVRADCIVTPLVSWTDSVDNGFGVQDRVFETTTTWGLGWGMGIRYVPQLERFEGNWELSADALNPLFAFSYSSTYDQASNSRTNETSYFLGGVFAPTVRMMAHVRY